MDGSGGDDSVAATGRRAEIATRENDAAALHRLVPRGRGTVLEAVLRGGRRSAGHRGLHARARAAATGAACARPARRSADFVPAPRDLVAPALEIACVARVSVVRVGEVVPDLALRARVLEAPTEGRQHLRCVINGRSQCEYMLYLAHGCH